MRIVLILLFLVIVLVALAMLSFRGDDLERTAKVDPSQNVQRVGFDKISALLTEDLNKVNVPLQSAAQKPANAFSIKARLHESLNLHEEYRVVDRACDLLIYADQEHSLRQQGAAGSSQNAEIQQQISRNWDEYRAKTAAEVTNLLQSLKGKQL